jgi:hypothetical protein
MIFGQPEVALKPQRSGVQTHRTHHLGDSATAKRIRSDRI